MSQYIFILLWIGLVGFLASTINFQRKELVMGHMIQRYFPTFAIVVFAPVIWMAATRGNLGDTIVYAENFLEMPSSLAALPAYLDTIKKDKGFSALAVLIKSIVGNHRVAYFFVIAAIQGLSLACCLRKYSPQYIFSVFLFVASTDYMSWMFNGIRQFTAVAILLTATGFILRKKWIPTLIIILLASTMHQSALLMIPIMIIVQGKAWNKKSILFLVFALIAVLYVDRFTNILDTMMQETQYASMVSDWASWNDDGTNALRVLVYSIPTILSVIGLKYIRAADDPVINLCTNMSIVSTSLYIISMFTSGIFMGRLPIYASLYNYILLPWELEHIFARSSARLIKLGTIIAYLLFYYFQMHITWGYI